MKKLKFNSKLTLGKETIAALNKEEMKKAKGGMTIGATLSTTPNCHRIK